LIDNGVIPKGDSGEDNHSTIRQLFLMYLLKFTYILWSLEVKDEIVSVSTHDSVHFLFRGS
jgi:hypothetical protein